MLNRILVLNLALLTAHQIDAAYWHEWDMFRMSGGIQLNVIINLLFFFIGLNGLVAIVQRRGSGYHWSLGIATICAAVLPIHGSFALAGFTQFDLPVSIAVIVATFPGALIQIGLTIKHRNEFSR